MRAPHSPTLVTRFSSIFGSKTAELRAKLSCATGNGCPAEQFDAFRELPAPPVRTGALCFRSAPPIEVTLEDPPKQTLHSPSPVDRWLIGFLHRHRLQRNRRARPRRDWGLAERREHRDRRYGGVYYGRYRRDRRHHHDWRDSLDRRHRQHGRHDGRNSPDWRRSIHWWKLGRLGGNGDDRRHVQRRSPWNGWRWASGQRRQLRWTGWKQWRQRR